MVNNEQLDAVINKASFYDDRLTGRISWNQNQKNHLQIIASGTSTAESSLKFIQTQPEIKRVGVKPCPANAPNDRPGLSDQRRTNSGDHHRINS